MSNSSVIKNLVESLPDGTDFSVSELIGQAAPLLDGRAAENPRGVVSQALFQMTKESLIHRVSWGQYHKGALESKEGVSGFRQTWAEADEYLKEDGKTIGYLTGASAYAQYGLGPVPERTEVATNRYTPHTPALAQQRGIVLKNPKTTVSAKNALYLQALDILDGGVEPFARNSGGMALKWLEEAEFRGLDFGKLVGYASKYYSKRTLVGLAAMLELAAQD